MLEINKKKVLNELARAKEQAKIHPDLWTPLASIGRCLHRLNDPEAADYFKRAIEICPKASPDPRAALNLGMMHRLAGEKGQAREYFRLAFQQFKNEATSRGPSWRKNGPLLHYLIVSAFLNDEDTAVQEYGELLVNISKNQSSTAFFLVKLAHARKTGNFQEADQVVGELETIIKKNRSLISESIGPQDWDWYEIALEITSALSPGQSTEPGPKFTEVGSEIEIKTQLIWKENLLSDRPNILSWHPTRKLLMIGSLGGTVIVLDVVTKEKDFIEGVSTVKVFQAKFSPVGDEIALAYGDGHIRFWTSDQKRIIKDIKAGEGAIYQLSWHPAGKAIVSLSEDRNIQLWNIEHQQPGWTINIPYAQSIDWSPKGDLLATWFEKIWLLAKADGDIRIAFPKAGSEIYVTCLDWHIQGDLIAAGGSDSDIRIWQISSKKLLYRLKRHSGEDYDRRSVTAVAFNPVNHTIASAGQDANIYVWDSDNRKLLYEFIEHEAPIEKIAWHPEGRILASCGLDGLVCLWDTMTGHILQRIEAHSGGVVELSWSPEGKYLASGGYDKTVKVWQISEAGA